MIVASRSSPSLPRANSILLRRWIRKLIGPTPTMLDVESLPDYMKRDLGLEGGRGTPPRDPFRD